MSSKGYGPSLAVRKRPETRKRARPKKTRSEETQSAVERRRTSLTPAKQGLPPAHPQRWRSGAEIKRVTHSRLATFSLFPLQALIHAFTLRHVA